MKTLAIIFCLALAGLTLWLVAFGGMDKLCNFLEGLTPCLPRDLKRAKP